METAFSARLRDRCDRVWAGLHAHPFLGELARGTLPLDRFRFFIEQDLLGACSGRWPTPWTSGPT